MWRAAIFAIVLLHAGLAAAETPSCTPSSDTRRVRVSEFQATGDGKSDDGPAIREALKAALNGSKPAALEFEAGKTYRIASFEDRYALQIVSGSQVALLGNGAEILLLPPNMALQISNSSDVAVCDLKIDYSPLPFTQGLVVGVDPVAGTFELQIESGFDVPILDGVQSGDGARVWHFAKPYREPAAFDRRIQIKAVRPGDDNRRVRITVDRPDEVRRLVPNLTHLVMVMPGMGHAGSAVFRVVKSDRVQLENLELYAVPKLSFYVGDNVGPVTFRNVAQRIRPGSNRVMTGWRGIFHVKDNRAAVTWDGCYAEGAFDDAFTIAAMYQLVTQNVGPNTWRLRDLSADDAPDYRVGDRLQAIDVNPSRTMVGESRIVSLQHENGKDTIVTLAEPLPLKPSNGECASGRNVCGSRVINLDASNRGSVIRACTVHGGLRLRSNVLVENSTFDGITRITADPTRVGPLPSHVTIKNSQLNGKIRIGSDRPTGRSARERGQAGWPASLPSSLKGWDTGERWATNIVFQNNRINAVIQADGASFSLLGDDIASPARKSIRLTNSGPVYLRKLTADGTVIANPMRLIKIGEGMSESDIVIDREK